MPSHSYLSDDTVPRRGPRAAIPAKAVAAAYLVLVIPVVDHLTANPAAPPDSLLWLLMLVPASVMAYYQGIKGAVHALGLGLVVLSAVQLALDAPVVGSQDPRLLLEVVGFVLFLGLSMGALAQALHEFHEDALQLALADPLTGLPNRRYADKVLQREFSAAQRGRMLTVVLFDLDDFKLINDRFGHEKGDMVLMEVAEALKRYTREMNLSARYGGEEFLTVLSSADVEGAIHFVQRILDAVSLIDSPGWALSMSAGIATYLPRHQSFRDLLSDADQALYEAKGAGKATYRVASRPLVPDRAVESPELYVH